MTTGSVCHGETLDKAKIESPTETTEGTKLYQ